MAIIRVKARQKGIKGYINCLRGSIYGNPFPLSYYSRSDSLNLYEKYLDWRIKNDEIFRKKLMDIYHASLDTDVQLGCTCRANELCHVDVLINKIYRLFNIDERKIYKKQSKIDVYWDVLKDDSEPIEFNYLNKKEMLNNKYSGKLRLLMDVT